MSRAAERSGQAQAGGTIVECTSGNTGVGSDVAAYPAITRCSACPKGVEREESTCSRRWRRVQLSRPRFAPESRSPTTRSRSASLASARRVPHRPVQQPPNPEATTAAPAELWEQTGGGVPHFVAHGTGARSRGPALPQGEKPSSRYRPPTRWARSSRPTTRPAGYGGPALQDRGRGRGLHSTATDFKVIDRVIACNDRDGLTMARRLARERRCSWAAPRAWRVGCDRGGEAAHARRLLVVLIPTSGERYLSKVHKTVDARQPPARPSGDAGRGRGRARPGAARPAEAPGG